MYELSGRWQQGSRGTEHPLGSAPLWMQAYRAEQEWAGVEEAVIRAVMEDKLRAAEARRAALPPVVTPDTAAVRMLAVFGTDPKPRTVLQLADTLHVSKRWAWRTIGVLVRDGQLRRQPRPRWGRPRWSYYGPALRTAAA